MGNPSTGQLTKHTSIGWFKGRITGNSHISWENPWFPVDFPLNQLNEHLFSLASKPPNWLPFHCPPLIQPFAWKSGVLRADYHYVKQMPQKGIKHGNGKSAMFMRNMRNNTSNGTVPRPFTHLMGPSVHLLAEFEANLPWTCQWVRKMIWTCSQPWNTADWYWRWNCFGENSHVVWNVWRCPPHWSVSIHGWDYL